MKKIIFIVLFLLLGIYDYAHAQSCSIPCCAQSFPYDFCNADGSFKGTFCSTNPNNGGIPVKTYFPGCVNIIGSMPQYADQQPNTSPPQPAEYLGDAYFVSFLGDDVFAEEYEEKGAQDQQSLDATRFDANEAPLDPDSDP